MWFYYQFEMIYEEKLFSYISPNKKNLVIYKIIISENSNSFIIKVKAADFSSFMQVLLVIEGSTLLDFIFHIYCL